MGIAFSREKWVVDGRGRWEVMSGPLYGQPVLFFCVVEIRAGPDSEDFPGNAIGIAVVMDMSSGYGGSEVDRGREREIISVIGSPNGLESVIGSQSIALPAVRPRAMDWLSVGTWFGISKMQALKNCEEIMVACFKVAGGMPEFPFPEPTVKKIGPFYRKSVVVVRFFAHYSFAC